MEYNYIEYYSQMVVTPAIYQKARIIAAEIANEPRYRSVSIATGVPVSLIGALHHLESDRNFNKSYFNGIDGLRSRTYRAQPKGQPSGGKPPFTWEQTAIAALKYDGIDRGLVSIVDPTHYGVLCQKAIIYNGLGYERKGVISPYGFSGTDLYVRGKYVADGRYSASAVSRQIGACVILRAYQDLENEGAYVQTREPHDTDRIAPMAPAPIVPKTAPAPIVPKVPIAPIDNIPDRGEPIAAPVTIAAYVPPKPSVRASKYFTFGEFTKNGERRIPNKQVENNIRNLAERLDAVREFYGVPVFIISGYRDPATNRAVGGVAQSSHTGFVTWMAADIKVKGIAPYRVYSDFMPSWEGGLGRGRSFTHFDTRMVPPNRRWNYGSNGRAISNLSVSGTIADLGCDHPDHIDDAIASNVKSGKK